MATPQVYCQLLAIYLLQRNLYVPQLISYATQWFMIVTGHLSFYCQQDFYTRGFTYKTLCCHSQIACHLVAWHSW